MDTHRLYIDSRCRICAVNVNDDKRNCEVSLFTDECKSLRSVVIEEDTVEIHPTCICHKFKKTLLRFRPSQQSGKSYETGKKPHQWMPHASVNCICASGEGANESLERPSPSGPGHPVKPLAGSDTDTASESKEYESGEYVAHIVDNIRHFFPALPAETALQLATELASNMFSWRSI